MEKQNVWEEFVGHEVLLQLREPMVAPTERLELQLAGHDGQSVPVAGTFIRGILVDVSVGTNFTMLHVRLERNEGDGHYIETLLSSAQVSYVSRVKQEILLQA